MTHATSSTDLTAGGRPPQEFPGPPRPRSRGITIMSPVPARLWQQVADDDPDALPEQTPDWLAAICSTGRFEDVTRLYHFHDGRMFVLPAVRRTGLAGLGGSVLSHPPTWGIGGLVGAGIDQGVVDSVVADLKRLPQQRILVRPNPIHDGAWASATASAVKIPQERCHILDLTGGMAALDHRMPDTIRQNPLATGQGGARVVVGRGGSHLDDFYRLYASSAGQRAHQHHTSARLGPWHRNQPSPLGALQAMARHLGPAFVIALAQVDRKPIYGAIMLLGRTAQVIRRAEAVDHASSGAVPTLVYRELLRLACAEGSARCHLGDVGSSPMLTQLADDLGAKPYDAAEYRVERFPVTRLARAARRLVGRAADSHDE